MGKQDAVSGVVLSCTVNSRDKKPLKSLLLKVLATEMSVEHGSPLVKGLGL